MEKPLDAAARQLAAAEKIEASISRTEIIPRPEEILSVRQSYGQQRSSRAISRSVDRAPPL